MKALQAYVDKENKWINYFCNQDPYEIKTAKGRQRVADSIDAALSPENLSCDGELSRSQVQKRWQALNSAALQLRQLDSSVKFYKLSL